MSDELDCLTNAYKKSKLSKLVDLKKNASTEDYPNGNSKEAIGNPHYSLILNGIARRDFGLLKVAYHVTPKDMEETGNYGMIQHVKQHKSAKLIKDGGNSIANGGKLQTYFAVDPEKLEEDLRKGFNDLAKKLSTFEAAPTNLCDTCTKAKKGCLINPSGPVSSCSLHTPKG